LYTGLFTQLLKFGLNLLDQKSQKMKRLILLTGLVIVLSIASFGQSATEWNKQGVEHAKKYEYKQAYECFTKAIELKADFAEAYYNRATVWFELPANTYANTDGCVDLKKAKSLGFKVKDETMKEFGCM
jgi:tetratricopeptide (TPR) repeat protein